MWVGELSSTNSGYSTYSKNILRRLYETGKYSITEFACFGTLDMVRNSKAPWKIISNLPSNKEEEEQYYKSEGNKYGAFKFNNAVLASKADVVIDIRDWWMLAFQGLSCFRRNFHWAIMPPVDSIPQPPQFLTTYKNANSVLSYTNWGKEVLEGNGIDVAGVASPAADYEVYKILDKVHCRNYLGINQDDIVILSVMRNQKRKQFPDLIEAFSKLLRRPELAHIKHRIKLHLHCQYPDVGWDLSSYFLAQKCVKNIIMTYACQSCNAVYADYFKDGRSYCKKCNLFNAWTPSSSSGVTEANMSVIYNSADMYVQYSSCEGFGMPIVEAAACGLKTFGSDYSATGEVIRTCGGTVVKERSLYYDSDAAMLRSLPDQDGLVEELSKTIINRHLLPAQKQKIRHLAKCNYNYDKAASVWFDVIDKAKYGNWNSPPDISEPVIMPKSMNLIDFVRQSIVKTAGRPDLLDTYWEKDVTQSLMLGVSPSARDVYGNDMSVIHAKTDVKTYSRDDFIKTCLALKADKNKWEKFRCGV